MLVSHGQILRQIRPWGLSFYYRPNWQTKDILTKTETIDRDVTSDISPQYSFKRLRNYYIVLYIIYVGNI